MGTVINLFGSPSAGKSRMKAKVFGILKDMNIQCEEANEFAKDIIYRGDLDTLKHSQPLIFGEQHHRIARVYNTVDYVICDSPLLLSLIYVQNFPDSFSQSCLDIFKSFNNLNFFIKLNPERYQQYGRTQSVEESLEIEKKILNLLNTHNIPFIQVSTPEDILRVINEKNQEKAYSSVTSQ